MGRKESKGRKNRWNGPRQVALTRDMQKVAPQILRSFEKLLLLIPQRQTPGIAAKPRMDAGFHRHDGVAERSVDCQVAAKPAHD